ncbi:hypothetical protein DFP93_101298 [Aneurinibacillus soli]|uniref:Uncharacterized protein n=1 Tax=Aneurinibacillus soli TaxID=1500254 RepID=A0A0U5BBX0_9BACL|nr:hypothetical protein [Aneurinibacillus soli]PYE64272.1 hypothetical protein DFP93_101298 [Aneurinibacillus soli]BAU28221.1 hypothetical protein CB4_02395 [Aneurinibacillus soli]
MKIVKLLFGENGYERIYNVLERTARDGDMVLVNGKDLHKVTAMDSSGNILTEGCAAFVPEDYQVVEFSGRGELDDVRYREEQWQENTHDLILVVNPEEHVRLVPDLTRQEVIEKAKQDIEELKKTSLVQGYSYYLHDGKRCDAKFSRENNKVVCEMLGINTYAKYAQGEATFGPTDCFNWHIGCAIALRQASGLSVPRYYTHAPQPTEVQVGDIVTHKIDNRVFEVEKVDGEKCSIVHHIPSVYRI